MPRQGKEFATTQTAVADVAGCRSSPVRRQIAPSSTIDIRILELLTARLCHELSGPVAGISNGMELLAEEDAARGPSAATSFVRDAIALVGDSARLAAGRLQFYRFAYGSKQVDAGAGPPPHELARRFFAASRIVCDSVESIGQLSIGCQQLVCNLLPVGADALPRGGRLALTADPLSLEAIGEGAGLSAETHAALILETPIPELTARTVQAYFAGLLAKALDRSLFVTTSVGRVRLTVSGAGA
jgi:histidine phosphotransferase ChpT